MTPEELKKYPVVAFICEAIYDYKDFGCGWVGLDNPKFSSIYNMKYLYEPKTYDELLNICNENFKSYTFKIEILGESELCDGHRVILNFNKNQ
jgi:hypothetical protein